MPLTVKILPGKYPLGERGKLFEKNAWFRGVNHWKQDQALKGDN
jgi:hypothetical protein